MADDRKPDNDVPREPAAYSNESAELKRKLVKRMAVAGVLIAALLGSLAVIDRLGEMDADDEPAPPPITAPVPVPQKEVTRPLTPPPAVEPAPTTVPPAGELPPKPDVAATPAVPTPPRVVSTRPISPPAPATAPGVPEGTAVPREAGGPAMPPPAVAPAPAVAVAPPVPAAKPPLPRPGRGYVVQAGVFTSVQLAEELHAKLTLNGIPSSLETRVHVGPFASQKEAEAARAKLKALGIDGLLIPPRGRR